MMCFITVVTPILSFIGGFIIGVFASGVRKMLALLIIPKKIHLGMLSKSEPSENRYFPYWYIPVSVKANLFWHLVVSSIDRVRASIEFVNLDTREIISFSATWVDLDDALLAPMGIGDEYKLRVATLSGNIAKAVGSIDKEDSLKDNYDINIELISGRKSLQRWHYPKAILNGLIREIEPSNREDS